MDSHTVQDAYLRGFLLDPQNPRFSVFSKTEKRWGRKSPKSTTTRPDYYGFIGPDGTLDNSLEHLLNATVESPGIKAIRQLAAGAELSQSAKESVATYVAYMLTKTTRNQKLQEQANAVLVNPEFVIAYIQKRRQDLERKFPASEIDAFIKSLLSKEAKIQLPQSWYLVSLRRSDEMSQLIQSMNWLVETTRGPDWFITSDHPAFVCRPLHPHLPYMVGLSRDDLGAELCFPLSPTTFFRASYLDIGNGRRRAPKLRVRELNRRVAIHATDEIVAPERTPEIDIIVAEEVETSVMPIDPMWVIDP